LLVGEAEVTATSIKTLSNLRPPEPLLLDKSIGNKSQGPIEDGEMMFTIGIEGIVGAATVTFTVELNSLFHSLQFRSESHFARITEGRSIITSPTTNSGVRVDDEVKDEEVYITKLRSSSHTQRVDGVIDFDLKRDRQANSFQWPPLLVEESNWTNTREPSLENTADSSKGGEGSVPGFSTSNTWPLGYSRTQLTTETSTLRR
jgi:hypothetical protein